MKRNKKVLKLFGMLGLCCAVLAGNIYHPVVDAKEVNKAVVDLSASTYDTSESVITSNTSLLEKNTVKDSIFGGNISWIDNGYGLWDATNDTYVEGVMGKLKNSGIQHLRYPGGTEGDYFHWEETIGAIEERKPQINCFSQEYPTYAEEAGVEQTVYFGVEEFLEVCQEAGIKATIQLNAGNGTVEEAVAYVKWLIDNNYIDMVDSICIGNENYTSDEVVGKTAEEYIQFCTDIFEGLDNAGIDVANLEIGVIGMPDDHPLQGQNGWDSNVLEELNANADFIDIHVGYSHYLQSKPDGTNATAEESIKCYLASTEWIKGLISDEESMITEVAGLDNISIQISECGPVGGDYPNSLAASLFVADFYNMVLNNSNITATDYLPVLNHYASAQLLGVCPRNPVDFGDTTWSYKYWDNCASYVFRMYSEQIGRSVLDTVVSGSSTFDSGAVGWIPEVQDVEEGTVNVYYDKTTGKGSIFVLNKSMTENLNYDLTLPYSDLEITNVTELWDSDPVAQNTYANMTNVTPSTYTKYNQQTYGNITLATKPVSLVKVDFEVGNYDVWEDDFSENTIANYKITGPDNGAWGNWEVKDGKLQVTGNKDANWYGTTCLAGGTYSDFIMEFDADVSAGYGVFVRGQDDGATQNTGLNTWFGGNTYAIMHWNPSETSARVEVWDYCGKDSQKQIETIAEAGTVGAMTTAHWKIVAYGGKITINITDKADATKSVSYVLNDMRYLNGTIGFYNLTKAGITSLKIDNLIITPVDSAVHADNFSKNTISNYKVAGPDNGAWGNWEVKDGKLQVTGNEGARWWGTTCLVDGKYSDFVMEFDADVSAGYGIVLRAQDDANTQDSGLNKWHSGDAYVIMHWAPVESNASVQILDFNGTSGGEVLANVGSVGAMASAHWKIIASGSDIIITISDNSNESNSVTYTFKNTNYTEGMIGFYNLTAENVTSFKVDNLSITPINSTLYENHFINSSIDDYFTSGPDNGAWGNWEVKDGKLQVTGNTGANWWGTSILTDVNYDNFIMEFDTDVSAGYGVFLRAQDDALVTGSGLNAWHSGNVYTIMHLRPVENDASVQILDYNGTSGGKVLANAGNVGAMTSAHWKIVAWGNTISIRITDNNNASNTLSYVLTDSTYTTGHIGFYNLTKAGVTSLKVDNLIIKGYVGTTLYPRIAKYTEFTCGKAPKDATEYRKDGYVFSGWFEDKACTKALSTSSTVEVAYAKYIDAQVLGVKAQVSKVMTDGTRALRFVTTADSQRYQKIGFYLEKDGKVATVGSEKIYTQLYAVGNRAETLTYVPRKAFSSLSNFFKTYTIYGFGESDYDTEITATPYWITQDGTTVLGETATKTINMGLGK